jgi:Zn-dependent peptidase ImmA (M78 family)
MPNPAGWSYNLSTVPRFETNPTPSVLTWARKSRGFLVEEAAKKIGIEASKLLGWEAGAMKPTLAQLRKASSVYKRPLAAFYLQEPPKTFSVMSDFRRHPDGVENFVSADLTLEIRRGYDRREWALDLLSQLDEKPKQIPSFLSVGQNIESAATQVRELLGVTVDAQSRWQEQAFKNWRTLVERVGVLTFEMTSISVEEARGFSISLRPMPVAVVNIKDAPRARIFTLLHELVHILSNAGGICSLDEHTASDSGRAETFCNQVAGAVIFPNSGMMSTEVVRRHPRGRTEWTDQELRALSHQFGGSRGAALIRLVTLGLTSQAFCDSRRAKFREEYRAERERKAQRDEGFVPPHQLAVLSAGPLFVSLVVENFNRERITVSDFSDYLQIRTKHIREVQQEYAGFTG